MSYEIPSQLEYQEKIIFGLTFEQLLYAGIFLPSALIVLFKTPWPAFLRWILSTVIIMVGICFMFFDLQSWLRNWYEYLKLRNVDTNSDRMIHFLEVKQIKDNVLTTKEKKLAFLKVEPINFGIKTQQEQEVIIQQFKKFLNSLDFPVQILMDTVPIRLEDYLTSLAKRVPPRYSEQFNEYKKHLLTIIEKDKILNRNFYLIIPQKDHLDIQVALCQSRLNDLRLKTKRLSDNEIGSVISKFYRGDPITFCPDHIENNIDVVKVNEQLNRIVAAVGYPRLVEAGFLDKIVMAAGDFDLALHIHPFPIEQLMVMLNKELQKQRADLYAAQMQNIINPSLEIQYNDTRATLENLQKGSEKLFMVSLYINCRANSEYQLNLLTRKVQSELNSLMIQPKVPLFRMIAGLKSVAPLAVDKLHYQRNITSNALSAFFPFTSTFLQVDTTGVGFGLNKNNIPLIRDIFKLSNPNGCILATSGSGKSYMAKLFIARHLVNGTNVIIIDPQSEYKNLVRKFHGEVIALHRTSQTMINPLDLMGHDYAEKRLSLMDLMQVMLGELTEPQKSFIDKALTETYARKGITEDPVTWSNKPPKLADLLIVLEQMEKYATVMEKTTVRSLVNRLAMYVTGVFSFCNQDTNMQCNDTLVCFDIGAMPKQVKPVIMFLVLDYVYMKMKKDIHRKLLVIDEAWALLERSEEASYIFEIVKTCRKFNLGLLLINQEVEGLLTSKAGKSVLANSAYTILMRQKPSVMKDMEQTFDLSKAEVNYLLSASVGQGILIMENDHSELTIVASPMEHELITTNADERLQQEHQENVQHEVTIRTDAYKGFYRTKDINLDELKYLVARKYVEVERFSIVSEQVEKFLIKPQFNESINHCFVVWDITEFLEKKGILVQKFITKKPDIVFECNGKHIAIEVETGIAYDKARKQLLEKVKELNAQYDYWFFVVTNRNYAKKYRTLGRTIEMRYLATHLQSMLKTVTPKSCKTQPIIEHNSHQNQHNSHPNYSSSPA